jgi:hypothetical protein
VLLICLGAFILAVIGAEANLVAIALLSFLGFVVSIPDIDIGPIFLTSSKNLLIDLYVFDTFDDRSTKLHIQPISHSSFI